MIIATKQWRDYEKGFKRILALYRQLTLQYDSSLEIIKEKDQQKYESSLLAWQANESAKRKRHEVALSSWNAKFAVSIVVGMILFLLTCLAAAFIFIFFSSTLIRSISLLLAFAAFGIFVILIILLIVMIVKKPKIGTPTPSPTKPNCYQIDIVHGWLSTISNLHATNSDAGTSGELILAQYLSQHLPNDHLALHSLLVDSNLDADLVIVGPTGIWVLESKYWQGEVYFKNGQWTHYRKFYLPGGIPDSEEQPVDFPPHEQWQIECRKIKNILSRKTKLDQKTLNEWVRGGIVFTHPDIEPEIDNSCPVSWGTIERWTETILSSSSFPELSFELSLQITDVLLDYANVLRPAARKSSVELAEEFFVKEKDVLEKLLSDYGIGESTDK